MTPSITPTALITPTQTPTNTMTPSTSPTSRSVRSLSDELIGLVPAFAVFMTSRALLFAPHSRSLVDNNNMENSLSPSNLTAGWTSTTMRSLYQQGVLDSVTAAASPVVNTMNVSVITAGEDLVLSVDLWVFQSMSLTPRSSIAHGVIIGDDSSGLGWLLHRQWASDSAAALLRTSPTNLTSLGGLENNISPTSFPSTPTGLVLSPTTLSFTLTGIPNSAALGPNSRLYGSSSSGVNRPTSLPASHTFTVHSSIGSLIGLVPAGSLKSGYIYTITASAILRATWSYAALDTVPLWNAWGSPSSVSVSGSSTSSITYASSDIVDGLIASAAYSPTLFVHLPPIGGTLQVAYAATPSVTTATGVALVDTFSLNTTNWWSPDTLVITDSISTAPFEGIPLPDAGAALLLIARGDTLSNDLLVAISSLSPTAALGERAVDACKPTIIGVLKPWERSWTLLTDPLGITADRACAAIIYGRSSPLRLSHSTLTYFFAVSPLSVTALLGSDTTTFVDSLGTITAMTALSLQARSGSMITDPPGTALSSRQSQTHLFTMLSTPGVQNGAGFVTILVLAIDETGGVGAASTGVYLSSPLSVSAMRDAGAIASIAGPAAQALVDSSPGITFAAAQQIASLLTAAKNLQSNSIGAAAAAAATITLTNAVTNALVSLIDSNSVNIGEGAIDVAAPQSAFAVIATNALQSDNIVVLDDHSLTLAATAVQSVSVATSAASISTSFGINAAVALLNASSVLLSLSSVSSISAAVLTSLPPVAGAAFLSAVSNIISAAATSTSTGLNRPNSTSDDDNLSISAHATLDALASATLRAAKSGDPPVTIATTVVSTIAAGGVRAYCGDGMSMTSARVNILDTSTAAEASSVTLPLGNALPPCITSGSIVAVPTSVVQLQPPPSINIASSALSTLKGDGGGRVTSIDATIIQWAVSPVSETAHLSSLIYAAPPRTGSQGKATDSVKGNSGRQRVLLSSATSWVSWGRRLIDELGSATAAKTSLAPDATNVKDLMPMHRLDTRVVSVSLRDSVTGSILNTSGTVFNVTLPLRDIASLLWNSTTASTNGYALPAIASPVFTLRCPAGDANRVGGGLVSAMRRPSLDSPITSAIPSTVIYEVSTGLSFSALAVGTSAGSNVLSASTLDVSGSKSWSGGAVNIDTSGNAALMIADCGAPWGNASFLCTGNSNVTFNCPTVTPTAACLNYDTVTAGWTNTACVVAAVTDTAVICSCTRLGDFAARFAALPSLGSDVFGRVNASERLAPATLYFAVSIASLVAVLIGGYIFGLLIGSIYDRKDLTSFGNALQEDREISFLSKILIAQGFSGVIDKLNPAKRVVNRNGGGSSKRGLMLKNKSSAAISPAPFFSDIPTKYTDVASSAAVTRLSTMAAVSPLFIRSPSNEHRRGRHHTTTNNNDRDTQFETPKRNKTNGTGNRNKNHHRHRRPLTSENIYTASIWARLVALLEPTAVVPPPAVIDAINSGFTTTAKPPNGARAAFDVSYRSLLRLASGPPLSGLLFDVDAMSAIENTNINTPRERKSGNKRHSAPLSSPERVFVAPLASSHFSEKVDVPESLKWGVLGDSLDDSLFYLSQGHEGEEPDAVGGRHSNDDGASNASGYESDEVHHMSGDDDGGETSLARARRYRSYLLALSAIRARTLHPFNPCCRFIPSRPRSTRAAFAVTSLITPLALSAWLYANLPGFSTPSEALPGTIQFAPLTIGAIILLGVISVAIVAPILYLIDAAFIVGGLAELHWRFPLATTESIRRKAFATEVSKRGGGIWAARRIANCFNNMRQPLGDPRSRAPEVDESSDDDGGVSINNNDGNDGDDNDDDGVMDDEEEDGARKSSSSRHGGGGRIDFASTFFRLSHSADNISQAPRCFEGTFVYFCGSRNSLARVAPSRKRTQTPLPPPKPAASYYLTKQMAIASFVSMCLVIISASYALLFSLLRGEPAALSLLCVWAVSIVLLTIGSAIGTYLTPLVMIACRKVPSQNVASTFTLRIHATRLEILATCRAASKVSDIALDESLALLVPPHELTNLLDTLPQPSSRSAARAGVLRRVYLAALSGTTPSALRAAAPSAIALRTIQISHRAINAASSSSGIVPLSAGGVGGTHLNTEFHLSDEVGRLTASPVASPKALPASSLFSATSSSAAPFAMPRPSLTLRLGAHAALTTTSGGVNGVPLPPLGPPLPLPLPQPQPQPQPVSNLIPNHLTARALAAVARKKHPRFTFVKKAILPRETTTATAAANVVTATTTASTAPPDTTLLI